LAFAAAAANPASPGFVPQPERIAAFDVDGTLIAEKPLFFTVEVALARLGRICPGYGRQGAEQAALCRAAAGRDRGYLLGHLGQVLSRPFAGMSFAAYRALAGRVWRQGINPKLGRPYRLTAYQPMAELMDLLQERGFTVYLNSGSDALALTAISGLWGLGPERCIGTRYQARPVRLGRGVGFVRTGRLLPGRLNLGQAKAVNMMMRAGRRPILAMGNSTGDAWLLAMAAGGRPGLALVLDHDDPREFVYAKPELLATARERGWRVVSMRRDWAAIFIQE
jgi:phosphoserine phosphatase